MAPKNVSALLAEQNEEVLLEMLDAVSAELARLQIEKAQIQEALAKKSRRPRSGGGAGRGGGSVRREQVLAVTQTINGPITTPRVRQAFRERGIEISGAAIRNHLRRLVELDRALVAVSEGVYALSSGPNGSGASIQPQGQGTQPTLDS